MPGVDENRPGIYVWHIEGKGSYVGKFKLARMMPPMKTHEGVHPSNESAYGALAMPLTVRRLAEYIPASVAVAMQ